MLRTLKNPVVTGVAGMAVAGMALGGVAQAGSDHGDRGGHDDWGKRYGDLLRSKNVYMNSDGDVKKTYMQRGRVTAIDNDSVTVRSKDGFSREYALRQPTDFDFCSHKEKVQVSDLVTVFAKTKGGTAVAKVVKQHTDENVKGHKKAGHSHDGHKHRKGGERSHDKSDKGDRSKRR
jgi:hypothetical protein